MTAPVDINAPDGGEAATERAATAQTARTLAQILSSQNQASQGVVEQPPVDETQLTDGVVPAPEGTEGVEGVGGATETEEALPVDVNELEQLLTESGLDLNLKLADVPAELLPLAESLVRQNAELVQSVIAQQTEANSVIQSVKALEKKLTDHPDRVLLTLAVTRPDVFKQAVAVFQEMENDPRAKEVVVRELQSEARLQEAERRENALVEHELRIRARQVIGATQRAARQHGVPYALAEKVVALAVQANSGQLEAGEVDGIVSELKGSVGARVAPKPRVATASKAAAVKAAPTAEVGGGSSAVPKKVGGLTEVTTREKGGGVFRTLIGNAAARLRSTPQ